MLMQDEYEKQRRIQENQGCRQRMVRKVSRLRVQKTKKTRNPGKSVQKSSPGGARNTRPKMKRKQQSEKEEGGGGEKRRRRKNGESEGEIFEDINPKNLRPLDLKTKKLNPKP